MREFEAENNPSSAVLIAGVLVLAGGGLLAWWLMNPNSNVSVPKPALSRLTDDMWLAIQAAAATLGADPTHLALVMNFESNGFNAQAVNLTSGASGLIQFMPSTARNLGTTVEAIRGMSAAEQMPLVARYFKSVVGSKPLDTLQAVAMAVFYPKYMDVPPDTVFPDVVQKSNPGIRTPRDYLNLVLSHAR